MPKLSTTGWMIDVLPLVPSPFSQWILFTVMSCSGERAREVAAALVVTHDELQRGAAESGEPFPRPERHRQVRIVVVDDVLDRLPRPEVLLPEAREVAGERQELPHEDLLDVGRRRGPGRE